MQAEPTYKTIIVDDESFNRDQLKFKLNKLFPEIIVAAECCNGAEGLHAVQLHHPDLIFLDVMMPVMDGFKMLEQIPDPKFEVIFISVSDQFAIKAIRLSAVDYLVKPLNVDELRAAIIRFKEKKKIYSAELLQNLLHNVHAKDNAEYRLTLRGTDGVRFIPLKNIVRCEANGSYTHFYLSNNKIETASKPLHDFEDMLTEKQFIRVHRSHMINKSFIREIKSNGFLVLEGSKQIGIARRKLAEVIKSLNK